MRTSDEAWGSNGRQSEPADVESADLGKHSELSSRAEVTADASLDPPLDAIQVEEKVDPSIGFLKICFATLSLWPPCGFVFAVDERPQSREDQCLISFLSSAVPLALGWSIAWLSICPFCTRHPFGILRRALFVSDAALAVATFASGILVIAYYLEWEVACSGGAEDACSLRVVALRVIVDVFGMGAIHLATALWMYFGEGICKRGRDVRVIS